MSRTNFKELLESGVHFGHLTRKWNPKMDVYIHGKKWYPCNWSQQNYTKLEHACAA